MNWVAHPLCGGFLPLQLTNRILLYITASLRLAAVGLRRLSQKLCLILISLLSEIVI